MALKFFKEIVAAIKEGIEEGRAEAAAESEAKLHKEIVSLGSEYSDEEIFAIALGGPLRRLFVGDNADILSIEETLPEKKRAELAKYLVRDFSVADRRSLGGGIRLLRLAYEVEQRREILDDDLSARIAETMEQGVADAAGSEEAISALLTEITALPPTAAGIDTAAPILALMTVRASYLATASITLGYIDRESGMALLSPFVIAVQESFTGWEAFGDAYLQGEKDEGINNAVGRKILGRQVERLHDGVWASVPWGTSG